MIKKFQLVTSFFFCCIFSVAYNAYASQYNIDEFTIFNQSSAYGVNDNDVVVGHANNPTEAKHAISYDFRNNIYTDLSPISAGTSWAHAINNQNVIVGGGVSDKYRAYYWKNGIAIDVTPTDSWGSNIIDINENNQAVGYSKDNITHQQHAILWEDDGTYEYLNELTYSNTIARAINDSGQIIGTANYETGLIWNSWDAEPIEIQAPSNWTYITPRGINNAGDVVGTGTVIGVGSHAFLYSNNQFYDLHDPIWSRSFAYDINDDGNILLTPFDQDSNILLGTWTDGVFDEVIYDGGGFSNASEINEFGKIAGEVSNNAVLFSPVTEAPPIPEPATILLFGLGLLSLAGISRKK